MEVSQSETRDAAYERESGKRSRRGAIAYCLISAAVALGSVPLDHLRFPRVAGRLLVIRLIWASVLGLIVLLLRSRYGARHPRVLGLLAPAAVIALLLSLAFPTGGHASPVLLSINFAILGLALLIPWPAAWTASAIALIVGGYVAGGLALPDASLGGAFQDNLTTFTAISGLAIALGAVLERRRWREFAHQWALAAAHRETRASAEQYRSVLDTAGSAIVVVSPEGRITDLNREAERVLGWRRDEAIGRDCLTLCIPEAVRASFAPAITRALANGPVRGLEASMVRRDGDERVLVCNLSRLADGEGRTIGVILSGQDITDRKRAEEALRGSERQLRTVIANAPVVLFTLDAAGFITLSEGRGLVRLGITPGQLVGQHISQNLRALTDDPERYLGYFERAFAGEEVTWAGSAGEATFECRLTPIRDRDGQVTAVIGVALDVTEEKRAEESRLALERGLLEAQKVESLGVLAGGVAHDFNNLLVSVLGNLSLAVEGLPADSPARAHLRRIEIAARRGSDLTRQMLAYAGKGRVMLERIDLNTIVEEMKDILEVSIGRRVTTRYELASDLPALEADPTQVRQMVMNLVINASESVGDGDGTITLRTGATVLGEAELRETQHAPDAALGPHVYLEVADTGHGMDPATIGRIFEPFFSTKVAGRGFGLATVLGVVRAHRGALQVLSEPGRGTTFRIFLPCGGTPARDAVRGVEGVTQDAVDHWTVLLVDDEADVRTVTTHMLERLGCSVLQAGDGREGVEVFRTHAQRIDAVLLDLTLPRLSGEGVFREIRGIRPDARVIMMSGYNDEGTRRRLAEGGLAGFLRKPFSVSDLRSTMGRALT